MHSIYTVRTYVQQRSRAAAVVGGVVSTVDCPTEIDDGQQQIRIRTAVVLD